MRLIACVVAAAAILGLSADWSDGNAAKSGAAKGGWQEEFALIKTCTLSTTGRGEYFVLEPGFQLTLESKDTKLVVTVLDETKTVDGVVTRVVEEKEWKNGELYEIARNYYAMCEQTKDAFYFGEDVDFYENGKVIKNDGSWLAGKDGARAGLIMPGSPKVGMKYYQEIAPGVAMDRAEIVKVDGVCKTKAGKFSKCMRIKEGTALDATVTEFKSYAPGIGLIGDQELQLIKYGPVAKN
jgi:hypothetical protein